MAKYSIGNTLFTINNIPVEISDLCPFNPKKHSQQAYRVTNSRNGREFQVREDELRSQSFKKFGSCKFTVNDLVSYTPRGNDKMLSEAYIVTEVLPNADGEYRDKDELEIYWIKSGIQKYLVFPTEIDYY